MWPCVKQPGVTATIVTPSGMRFVGTNDIAVPVTTCPRIDLPRGVGYEKCRDVCKQPGHAEEMAIRAADDFAFGVADLRGSRLYLEGHDEVGGPGSTYPNTVTCPKCTQLCCDRGIAEVIVGPPPADPTTVIYRLKEQIRRNIVGSIRSKALSWRQAAQLAGVSRSTAHYISCGRIHAHGQFAGTSVERMIRLSSLFSCPMGIGVHRQSEPAPTQAMGVRDAKTALQGLMSEAVRQKYGTFSEAASALGYTEQTVRNAAYGDVHGDISGPVISVATMFRYASMLIPDLVLTAVPGEVPLEEHGEKSKPAFRRIHEVPAESLKMREDAREAIVYMTNVRGLSQAMAGQIVGTNPQRMASVIRGKTVGGLSLHDGATLDSLVAMAVRLGAKATLTFELPPPE